MSLFPSDRSLLFPQFETYKLHPLDPENNIRSFDLPGQGATQSRVSSSSSSTHLSFKEVRNRIGWDHLALDPGTGRGVYVDKEWNVIGFTVDDDLTPTFTQLASLPIPISASSTNQQSEFPAAFPLSPSRWAISSGSGSLYIMSTPAPPESSRTGKEFAGKFTAKYELDTPFLLRAKHVVSEDEVKLLLTRSVRPEGIEGKRSVTTAQSTTFELMEISINPNKSNQVDGDSDSEELKINWRLRGGDLPIYTSWANDGWLVLCSEEFKVSQSPEVKGEVKGKGKESESELESRTDPGSSSGTGQVNASVEEDKKRYPYSWTQDSDSINIKMPLPPQIKREAIKLDLTPTTLSIFINSPESVSDVANAGLPSELKRFLQKSTKAFWTNINPALSTWSFDSDKPRSQIEIDLAKVDHNVRWPSVFSPAGIDFEDDGDEDEDGEEEVPETLSSEFLASVRESFSHVKTRGQDGNEAGGGDVEEPSGPFHHPTMPALLREEMDLDEEDQDAFDGFGEFGGAGGGGGSGESSKVGKEVLVGYISTGEGGNGNGNGKVESNWSKNTIDVLSTPFSQAQAQDNDGISTTITIKNAVDGLSFTPPSSASHNKKGSGDISQKAWDHVSTNPALAFVLSSKRDLRLVKQHTSTTSSSTSPAASSSSGPTEQEHQHEHKHEHEQHEDELPHQSKQPKLSNSSANKSKSRSKSNSNSKSKTTVLAFDSGSSLGQGNMYIYYPPQEGEKMYAKQGVLPISGGEKGALLGVDLMIVNGRNVVVSLTEKNLIIIKDVL
ncbi:uncharacterized protein I303_104305 [Kwoniella dejecticola CBS 10117]|uniref:NudC domain-containing protein 1 n=1 Tax=Kwoniella dejecticola CBS 10117 TaxID=1296121 RepID=A0A1A6A5Q4_9TREE|nr:uncharacterized protein I303_04721 [Kwoniella dejecticola CBS 10117]OBR85386.1 hypothetical protein I303_04721 [Kwoniella dejecticola CBS 10117]